LLAQAQRIASEPLSIWYTCCLCACSIFQQRLQRSAEQQAAAADVASVNDAAGAAAEPSVSFFGLIKEGRLSRNQAAVLFYQVCGKPCTSTAVIALIWLCGGDRNHVS
jgi:hypothetical protein